MAKPKQKPTHYEENYTDQPITKALEDNYMPYAMSVIVSRAIPEIDGFKPSHRKLLYTMFKMGLLTGDRTKSANVVGSTMKLNPHGDAAIYDTMVRLTRDYDALLTPYVDSKGNFGKVFSRDMAWAAARYTEVKLDSFCSQLFTGIDKNAVDMVDNYDGTTKEPVLLPTTFPSILVNANQGIAVGMASNICSFNLAEVCDTAVAIIENPDHNLLSTLLAPDFTQGAGLVYNAAELAAIYATGRGSVRLRAKYEVQDGMVIITEIPYTTTVEAIVDKVVELAKSGKLREVADIRDEVDRTGLKIAVELRRGADPDKVMQKLFKLTTLEDTFSCNFNVLIDGIPKVLGVREIIEEWTTFRLGCLRRTLTYDAQAMAKKLHLLEGLKIILLDIDKAVRIVRETEEEQEVVPNLMIGFGVDEEQAEYIAEIKLRALNREHVLTRLKEVDKLAADLAALRGELASEARLVGRIVRELKEVKKKYGAPRKTEILYDTQPSTDLALDIPDYAVTAFITREGYFKKITPASLRMSGDHRLKEGDEIVSAIETTNRAELIAFSSAGLAYKTKLADFEDGKTSVMGVYLPSKLGFDENESVVGTVITTDYEGYVNFFFENGKAARIPLPSYATKTNRRKLTGAFSTKSPLVGITAGDDDVVLTATSGKVLLLSPAAIPPKSARDTLGVQVMRFTARHKLAAAVPYLPGALAAPDRHRAKKLPAAGVLPEPERQLELE